MSRKIDTLSVNSWHFCLDEKAVLLSGKDLETRLDEARGVSPSSQSAWTVSAAPDYFWIDPSAELAAEVSVPRDSGRPATTRDWALAEAAAENRDRAA